MSNSTPNVGQPNSYGGPVDNETKYTTASLTPYSKNGSVVVGNPVRVGSILVRVRKPMFRANGLGKEVSLVSEARTINDVLNEDFAQSELISLAASSAANEEGAPQDGMTETELTKLIDEGSNGWKVVGAEGGEGSNLSLTLNRASSSAGSRRGA